jgi:hypothetical protein
MKMDELYIMGGAILFVVGFVALLMVGANVIDRNACYAKAEHMKVQATHSFLTNCVIEYQPGKWVPLHNYRVLGQKID